PALFLMRAAREPQWRFKSPQIACEVRGEFIPHPPHRLGLAWKKHYLQPFLQHGELRFQHPPVPELNQVNGLSVACDHEWTEWRRHLRDLQRRKFAGLARRASG